MSTSPFFLPGSFDENLASLLLNAKSNNLSESFVLAITANFGQADIRISCGGVQIDALAKIYKANISLSFVNSYPGQIIFDINSPASQRVRESIRTSIDYENTVRSGRGLGSSVVGSFDAGAAKGNFVAQADGNKFRSLTGKHVVMVESERDNRGVRLLSHNTIDISYNRDAKLVLEGTLLNDDNILQVFKNSLSGSYGVSARVLVREPWIELKNISVSGSGKLTRAIRSILGGNQHSIERYAFRRLLSHLVLMQLQSPDDLLNACLVHKGVFIDPDSGEIRYSLNDQCHDGISQITGENAMLLEKFAFGDSVTRREIIQQLDFDESYSFQSIVDDGDRGASITTAEPRNEVKGLPASSTASELNLSLWQEFYPISSNRLASSGWIELFQSYYKFRVGTEIDNLFLVYLYSLSTYPIIPADDWMRICIYVNYKFQKSTPELIMYRNGFRSAVANSMELQTADSSRVINFTGQFDDHDIEYDAGSWMIGGLALVQRNFSETEDSIYQYAVCLDNAGQVVEKFDIETISAAVSYFVRDNKISDANKIVALVVIMQDKRCHKAVFDALVEMKSAVSPSTQIGMMNYISLHNDDIKVDLEHRRLREDLKNLTIEWLRRMSYMFDEYRRLPEVELHQEFDRGFADGAVYISSLPIDEQR